MHAAGLQSHSRAADRWNGMERIATRAPLIDGMEWNG